MQDDESSQSMLRSEYENLVNILKSPKLSQLSIRRSSRSQAALISLGDEPRWISLTSSHM
jgi:hypothetical protein